jgi:hypothetical protein
MAAQAEQPNGPPATTAAKIRSDRPRIAANSRQIFYGACSFFRCIRRFNMSDTAMAKAVGMGIAGGAIAAALLDLLVAKGVIDAGEGREVLEDAMYRAAMYTGTFEGLEASKIIGDMLNLESAA